MEITQIKIVVGQLQPDAVYLHTNLPPTMPKISNQEAILEFHCAKDTAIKYCERNFPGIPVEVIKCGDY